MMAPGCMVLTCLLLIQMAALLIMLNPIYDVMKLTKCINNLTKGYRRTYLFFIAFYFTSVLYLGMYLPLQSIHTLIFSDDLLNHDKVILLHSIEKNYITAGFSLFLVVVLYGVRALLEYTASLTVFMGNQELPVQVQAKLKKQTVNESILPNLLRVKRSISYETVLLTNELREKLKIIIKGMDHSVGRTALTSILEANQATST